MLSKIASAILSRMLSRFVRALKARIILFSVVPRSIVILGWLSHFFFYLSEIKSDQSDHTCSEQVLVVDCKVVFVAQSLQDGG